MSYKIDFSEPIPKMIERLVREHRELGPKLDEIESATEKSLDEGVKLLLDLRTTILRHAVEEEARVIRVIMKDSKSQSAESVKIMQEHRWVSEFLERRIDKLSSLPEERAHIEIQKFVADLRQHFKEEEEVVFPLALESVASEK